MHLDTPQTRIYNRKVPSKLEFCAIRALKHCQRKNKGSATADNSGLSKMKR